jgi:hypothetical protein
MKSAVLVLILCQSFAHCFKVAGSHRVFYTERYYDYFKKNKDGEKKDIGRLWKNIIFPGIYYEYADTKEPIKTVKVEVEDKNFKSRRSPKPLPELTATATATYNVVDERSVPVYDANGIRTRTMKPIQRPQNFTPPQPKPMMISSAANSISVLPNFAARKLRTPLILYDDIKNEEGAIVRKACSVLDLTVEIRPCPGMVLPLFFSSAVAVHFMLCIDFSPRCKIWILGSNVHCHAGETRRPIFDRQQSLHVQVRCRVYFQPFYLLAIDVAMRDGVLPLVGIDQHLSIWLGALQTKAVRCVRYCGAPVRHLRSRRCR